MKVIKTISIGDIHGHPKWKEVIPRIEDFDYVIFIADYVDSYTLSNDQIRENLGEIIEFKKKYPEKVILLEGNHDASYAYFPDLYYRCEGFRAEAQFDLTKIFYENRDFFQIAFQLKNYLWTHAGVSKRFLKQLYETPLSTGYFSNTGYLDNYALWFNMLNRTHLRTILHQKSSLRNRILPSTHIAGGVTWADRRETENDLVEGLHQIVGHTPINRNTTIFADHRIDTSITYIDSLGSAGGGFYELEIPIA